MIVSSLRRTDGPCDPRAPRTSWNNACDGLCSSCRRVRRLEPAGKEKLTLLRMLQRGPRRAGPALDRWTFGRVVELYRQAFGIDDPVRIRQALTGHGWRWPRLERRPEAIIAGGEFWRPLPWIQNRYT